MQNFPDILRHWRKQRRYSQLDLALEANISSRHLSFLETGRSKPSREMVQQLSDALSVPLDARNRMLTSAGYAPKYPKREWDDAEMLPIRKAIDWALNQHAPYPGLALDRLWVIRRMNEPAKHMFGTFGVTEGSSMLDLIQDPTVQDLIENWPEVAHHSALRLRSESAAQGGIPELDAAADILSSDASPSEPNLPAIPTVFKLGEQMLSLFGTIAQFGTTADEAIEDLKIELFFPADEAAEDLLKQLAVVH